jgi:hypothetical protein
VTWLIVYVVGILVCAFVLGMTDDDISGHPWIMIWPLAAALAVVAAPILLMWWLGGRLRGRP